MQTTEETHPDPHGFENTENSELNFDHIHCESTHGETETKNTLSLNTLHIKT